MLKTSMQYRARLARLVTPQAERNPGTRLLVRDAPAWPANEWERFDRFLIFGNERGTYFLRKRVLSVEEASNARACIAADGPRAVRRLVELSAAGRAMNNDTCLFALAMCVVFGNKATRMMALEAAPEVARACGEARVFAAYLQELASTRGESPNAAPGDQRGSGSEAVASVPAAASHTLRCHLAVAG